MKKAVCLVSGGMDSYVSAALAKYSGYRIFVLTVNYRQKNSREIASAQRVASILGAERHVVLDVDLSWTKSALTDKDIDVPEWSPSGTVPATYVPARNTVLISLAVSLAETVGAEAVYLGVNAVDFSGYPDCRPEYIKRFQSLIDIATEKTCGGEKIALEAPLIGMSKSEIIKKGRELGVDFSVTWSCYVNGKTPCGRCPSCVIREKGFMSAGIGDPLKNDG